MLNCRFLHVVGLWRKYFKLFIFMYYKIWPFLDTVLLDSCKACKATFSKFKSLQSIKIYFKQTQNSVKILSMTKVIIFVQSLCGSSGLYAVPICSNISTEIAQYLSCTERKTLHPRYENVSLIQFRICYEIFRIGDNYLVDATNLIVVATKLFVDVFRTVYEAFAFSVRK